MNELLENQEIKRKEIKKKKETSFWDSFNFSCCGKSKTSKNKTHNRF
jgi:hypothetical protein